VLIEDTVRANGLKTVEQVANYTKAGGGCASCHEKIEEIIAMVMAENGETFDPNADAEMEMEVASAPAELAKGTSGMTNLQRMKRIEMIIESIRPQLQADRGDVELVDVIGNTIYVNMTGACSGCQMAAATLGGIQQRLIEDLGEMVKVLPHTELPKAV
jgi:NifU-like protein